MLLDSYWSSFFNIIIFITQNTYNIDFANHISFVKSENRTEEYYRNIVEKWFLTKTDM